MQEDNVFITAIIPAYHVQEYIEECIDSLLKLSVSKEILVVIDSWEDPTVQACKKYNFPHSDVRLVLNDNKGMSEARNTALRIAKGEYIWFVDADDYVCETYCDLAWNKLQKCSPEILMFDAGVQNETNYDWDENNYIRRSKIEETDVFSGINFFQKYYLRDAYRTPVWLNLFSREYINLHKLSFLKNSTHEDEDFTFRAILYAKKVIYFGEKLYIRRYRLNSAMTSGFHEKQIDDFFRIMQGNTKFVQSLCDAAMQNVYQRYLYDRMNLLIDRIRMSDIVDKIKWYRIVAGYFYEYISNYNKGNLSSLLMLLEVIFHAETVAKSNDNDAKEIFDKNTEKRIFVCWQKEVRDKIERYMKKKEGVCLGIYGAGKHTKWLFPVFKKIADERKLDMVFIDSVKESYADQFEGYDVINVRDIKQNTLVIISSFFMQDEIYEIIRSLKIPCKIIKIYD